MLAAVVKKAEAVSNALRYFTRHLDMEAPQREWEGLRTYVNDT
jgi:hypothetical protein